MNIEARCGHVEEKSYADAHQGLCKCHSNFVFLLVLEQREGEDALIEYWFAMILSYLSARKEQEVECFIDHLIEYYDRNLIKSPSKQNYIRKMLLMLHSLQEPFDTETLR
jgi:hypothetical protein